MVRIALISALFAVPTIVACGSSSPSDSFATFQACWDEHHTTESFDAKCSIEICCIDHQIGSTKPNMVCGMTAQDCMTYVTANLTPTSATNTDITTACMNYLVDGQHGGTGAGGMCGS